MRGPRAVFILSDGIRGHANQSRGLGLWLSRLAGSLVHELEIPKLRGMSRFMALKVGGRQLPRGGKDAARLWLERSGGMQLLADVGRLIQEEGLSGRDILCLSTGSAAAPFSLAIARVFGGRSATVMTPSVLGAFPFDFAIIPAHDSAMPAQNIFETLGAPNAIDMDTLAGEAERLLERFPPRSARRWGVLVGGDDANYRISGRWLRRVIGALAEEALSLGADLYLTTSRRTTPEAENELLRIASEIPAFRMLLLASKDPSNPVPGMLGSCEEIFCTEDSVSMVSEAATAGFMVNLLRVERKAGARLALQKATTWLARSGALPKKYLWGAPRFDAMLEAFKARGLARESIAREGGAQGKKSAGREGFNEARDAAAWIIDRWEKNEGGSS